jgi:hypothetical protein
MNMPTDYRIEFLRQAGYVSRMHVNRVINGYDSNEHVHNMTNLLLVLHPDPSVRLVKLVHWHDVGEYGSGDVPSPPKALFGFGECNNLVEKKVREFMGFELDDVTEEETRWVKSLDWLEFWMFLQDQLSLGNQFVQPIYESFTEFMVEKAQKDEMPPEVAAYFSGVLNKGRPAITNDWLIKQIMKGTL